MTTGILTTDISIPPLHFLVVDVGGQRNERRKWLHAFDDVSALVFVVNLAGYHSVLYEDQATNRMQECINLFKATVNNPIFNTMPVFLLLNKKDLFEKLIETTPITACPSFQDYQGPNETLPSLEYISAKFKEQVQSDPDRLQVFYVAARYF